MDTSPSVPLDRRPQLRAEAIRQLRWHRQRWEQVIAAQERGLPALAAIHDRAWLISCLDLLHEAGEEVPERFYRRGSLVLRSDATGGAGVARSLASLVADVTQVLTWLGVEEPGD